MYVVYVNHPKNMAMIHQETCHIFQNRARDETINGYWRIGFNTIEEAESFAQSTGKAHIDTCAKCIEI